MNCNGCGADIDPTSACPYCGAAAMTPAKAAAATVVTDISYQQQFEKFDKNNGQFTPTFNLWALLFGAFWYIYKGMWVKGLILLALNIAFSSVDINTGFASLILVSIWVYGIIAGNYDYYRYVRGGKKQPFSDGKMSWW